MIMNNINNIVKEKCTGCTACFAVCNRNAISFVANEEGFVYPKVDDKLCVHCGLCEKVCPTLGYKKETTSEATVYAVINNNPEVLKESSSGGFFTAISDYVLNYDGVVYGAIQNENIETIHTRASSNKERDLQRGSKYVQSDLRNSIKLAIRDLKDNKIVLFTGTPCQIAGISNVVGNSPLRKNLILMDVICNGAPSPMIFQKYLSYCNNKFGSKIIKHLHRPKDYGWGHVEKNYFENGRVDNKSKYSQAWKCIFYSGNILRKCCYACPYANLERVSDITIGDFWGIQNTDIKLPTKQGVSVCIINTKLGEEVFAKLKDKLVIKNATIQDAIEKQPRLRGVCAKPDHREEFWDEYWSKGAKYVIEKYGECTPYLVFKYEIKKILIKLHLWK